MSKPLIIFIHGALSSAKSWNYVRFYLRRQLKDADVLMLEYDITSEDAADIVDQLYLQIVDKLPEDNQVFLVGHSFGGILAVELARRIDENACTVVTLSSPFGGSGVAMLLKLFKPSSHLYKNIGTYDTFMSRFRGKSLDCPTYSFITSSDQAADFLSGPNDSVVTVSSQEEFNEDALLKHKYVSCNHFEVLLSPAVSKDIGDILANKVPKEFTSSVAVI